MHLLLSEELYSIVDEYDYDGSDSGSSGMCSFLLYFDYFVVHVNALGSVIFVPIGVESKCVSFVFVVFV